MDVKKCRLEIENESDYKRKVFLIYDLCLEYVNSNIEEYQKYLDLGIKISRENNFQDGIEYGKVFFASDERKKGNNIEAIRIYLRAIELFERIGNKKMIAFCMNGIASIYYYMKNYDMAYSYDNKAIVINEEIGDRERIAVGYVNLAVLLHQMGKYDEEIEISLKVKRILEEEKSFDYIYGMNLVSLIRVYAYLDKIELLNECIADMEKVEKLKKYTYSYTVYLTYKGYLLMNSGQVEEGYEYVARAIDVAKETEYDELLANAYFYAELYFKHKRKTEMRIDYLKKAFECGKNAEDEDVEIKALEKIIRIYTHRSDYKSALEMKELLYEYRVECFNRENELKVKSIEFNAKIEHLEEKLKALEEIASKDQLTGAYNRRYLVENIDKFSDSNTYSVLLLDVDDFKDVNDRYGHTTGDKVLQKITSIITKVLGDKGVVGRYGGDEFIVLIKEINESDLSDYIREIKNQISFIEVDECTKVSVSGGLIKNITRSSLEKALISADKLLYDVKAKNKNDIYIGE